MSGNDKRKRTQFETKKTSYNMPKELYDQLYEVASEIGTTSITEVFRRALKFYLHLYYASKDGGEVLLKDKHGNIKSYEMRL